MTKDQMQRRLDEAEKRLRDAQVAFSDWVSPEAVSAAVAAEREKYGRELQQALTRIANLEAEKELAVAAERERGRELIVRLVAAARQGWGHVPESKALGECAGCDAVRDAEELLSRGAK